MATTAQPKVFVTRCREAFPADKMVILESKYQVIYWKEDSVIPREDLISSLHDKDALFCLLTDKIDSEVLDAAPNMKVIATMSVGYDHLDLESMKKRGIRVGYTPGVLTAATAELTLGLLLATSRRLMEASRALQSGKWSSWSPLWMCGTQLKDSTVGIVGLGSIGTAVMERLIPFGVKRIVYSGRTKKDVKSSVDVDFVDFEDLLRLSDFVIVTCSYYPELKHLFNKEAFEKMKKSAVFINTSRGGIVNQDDLVTALTSGTILAAGLDVMTPEPFPPDHTLAKLDNCVLLPHLGSAAVQTRTEMAEISVNNIIAGLEGGEMPAGLC